ncbi:hypothetical protein ABB37_00221 [Leptomonas pyrrhocoris]|uniref:Uncharacterized protein n=1 Tax=Leptomonas pyrrhocoris TaxID=157538 RepID=A0A0M9GA67_LEPPY|nr:hypothetical protein ABB37_00221 [Leptomonas pyrrhocoris]XP_015664349.1 hypothetical protein ABB37_00221 [Leptomonas pyrrhocoris]KPA85909.1 hypothetical protein ABB37_00221 [Leptomonas pyrrhocoris]KPA85910.1 hypothetical protein ABB37_00221 [Leptomonas pyrrhocoris]|eukprot:XP_015664348.1 hypothetical protein ABB37_00221 [Leptomonas pyrrhocoris]
MDRTPASPSLQVYTSDVLLFLCTLISLAFRTYRQSIALSWNDESGAHEIGREEWGARASSAAPLPLDERTCEGLPLPHNSKFGFPTTGGSESFAAPPLPENDDHDDHDEVDESLASFEVAMPVNVASDPLLILAERLTLEEKLSTAVNWLSLVSNCLTYSLRPSQVLYTFLFTNGDFVLFVTSYSNRYRQMGPSSHLHPQQPPDAPLAPSSLRPQRQHAALLRETGASALQSSRSQSVGSEVDASANSLHGRYAGNEAQLQDRGDVAAVAVPLPSHAPLPASAKHGPRHRENAQYGALQRRVVGAGAADLVADSPHPVSPKSHAFRVGRLLPRLHYHASRCVAFAQTQLSWLLVLNALLTSTLVVFYLHHLFFGLGTLFGYLAAVASVFLCGMEMGCIAVRLRRRKVCGRGGGGCGTDTDDLDDCGSAPTTGRDPRCSSVPMRDATGRGGETAEWDPSSSGLQGPCWAFLGEHLSATACSLLYLWMLLEEGDALWSSHVALMRWYVGTCALMTLSLLKCLRAFL